MVLNSGLKVLFLLCLALILMLWVSLNKISNVLSEDQIVNLPNLEGMDILEASQKIEQVNRYLSRKICLNIRPILNDKHLKYTVVKQEPSIGGQMSIKGGRNVSIVVSKGNLTPKIPNYMGKPFKQVRRELYSQKFLERSFIKKLRLKMNNILKNYQYTVDKKLKKMRLLLKDSSLFKKVPMILVLGKIIFVHDKKVDQGKIIDQDPKPGKAIYEDITLNFVVSLGPPAYLIARNYTGSPVEIVSKELSEKNIFVKLKNIAAKHQKSAGTVISQSIGIGQKMYPGDEVLLQVLVGPLAKYKLLNFIVPQYIIHLNIPEKGAYLVKLEIEDSSGLQVVFEGIRKIGQVITEAVKVLSKAKVRIWLEGKLYKSYSI